MSLHEPSLQNITAIFDSKNYVFLCKFHLAVVDSNWATNLSV